ncbi:hypothetical protein LAZ67_22000830 [Cordylochernes scorpioides]|uniref:Uncharacterized protein n=1 Tax=Cordylochernes scorpioides TaxID=51811 RepID=A0ABY6LNI1_9ARAC|nr:hypothetical protein LAZ67_22000830 [Cordylochernes scorpioides]
MADINPEEDIHTEGISVDKYCDQGAHTDLICSMDKTPPPPCVIILVHPKALLKEMGRHDITFTADNAKDHYGGRKFRVHHDSQQLTFPKGIRLETKVLMDSSDNCHRANVHFLGYGPHALPRVSINLLLDIFDKFFASYPVRSTRTAPSFKTIYYWMNEFKNGQKSTQETTSRMAYRCNHTRNGMKNSLHRYGRLTSKDIRGLDTPLHTRTSVKAVGRCGRKGSKEGKDYCVSRKGDDHYLLRFPINNSN